MLEERRWVPRVSLSLGRVSFVQPYLSCYCICKLHDIRAETEECSLNLLVHKRKAKVC